MAIWRMQGELRCLLQGTERFERSKEEMTEGRKALAELRKRRAKRKRTYNDQGG
jgi:hypothetical protein